MHCSLAWSSKEDKSFKIADAVPDALCAHGLQECFSHFLPFLVVGVVKDSEEIVMVIRAEELQATRLNLEMMLADACRVHGDLSWK